MTEEIISVFNQNWLQTTILAQLVYKPTRTTHLISNDAEVARAMDLLGQECAEVNLGVNHNKSNALGAKPITPSLSVDKNCAYDAGSSLVVFGSPIGNHDFIKSFLYTKAVEQKHCLDQL